MRVLLVALILWLGYNSPVEAPRRPSDGAEACLATTLWHEARGEPVAGQRAVLDTVLNRAVQSRLHVCAVIAARGQFQWHKKHGFMPYTEKLRKLLQQAYSHPKVLKSEKSRWFYSSHLPQPPYWAKMMDCRRIGNHWFCAAKEKNASSRR